MKKLYSLALEKGFEPLHAVKRLLVFETSPFNRLGTPAPNHTAQCYYSTMHTRMKRFGFSTQWYNDRAIGGETI